MFSAYKFWNQKYILSQNANKVQFHIYKAQTENHTVWLLCGFVMPGHIYMYHSISFIFLNLDLEGQRRSKQSKKMAMKYTNKFHRFFFFLLQLTLINIRFFFDIMIDFIPTCLHPLWISPDQTSLDSWNVSHSYPFYIRASE